MSARRINPIKYPLTYSLTRFWRYGGKALAWVAHEDTYRQNCKGIPSIYPQGDRS